MIIGVLSGAVGTFFDFTTFRSECVPTVQSKDAITNQ
jgi:hypothetical protein